MDRSWHGPVAVVAVQADRRSAELEAGRLAELAAPLRGGLLVEDGAYVVLAFTSVPRAADFCVAQVEASAGSAAGPRFGVHVGELVQRDDAGRTDPTVRRVTSLADRARPGQIVVSRAVAEILGTSAAFDITEVEGPDEAPPAFAVTAVTTPRDAPPSSAEPATPRALTPPPERVVDQVRQTTLHARLTEVVARAGAGKTTAVRAVAERHPTVWLSVPPEGMRPAALARAIVEGLRIRVPGIPATLTELAGGLEAADAHAQRARAETLAASVAGELTDLLPRDLLVVVDGVDGLVSSSTCRTLLEALARNAPAEMHLVLLGRRAPGLRTERLASAGVAARIDEAVLGLTDEEVAALASSALGPPVEHDDVTRVVDVAGGHPETAVLAAAGVRHGRPPAAESAGSLAREVLARQGDGHRSVLEALAALGPSATSLLRRVTRQPVEGLVAELVADGLVRRAGPAPDVVEVGAAAGSVIVVSDEERRRVGSDAARELRAVGDATGALRVLGSIGDDERRLRVVREEGRRLLAEGAWPVVLDAVGAAASDPSLLGDDDTAAADVELAGLVGEAWRLAGDQHRALTWFRHASRSVDPVPAWLAWRMGVLLHFGGELDQARALYARGDPDGAVADRALMHAWSAAAAWLQSDLTACREQLGLALELARERHDDQVLAATHTVRAMLAAVDGDRASNDQHYLRALDHAERAGDLMQIIRIHTNRGSRLLEEGEHAESLAELELALRTADLVGPTPVHGMALSNRGQVLRRLGRLDEAVADLTASREIFERTGSRWVAYSLTHLGDLYRVRGDRALALGSYEEALSKAEPVGDTQAIVPALTGLALLDVLRDPDRARELADRACEYPDALGAAEALAARSFAALVRGEDEVARRANDAGMRLARRRRDRPALATHLEIRARIAGSRARAHEALREARDLWERMECPLEVARVDGELVRYDDSPRAHATAERALRTLRSHGARAWADAVETALATRGAAAPARLRVKVFGAFELEREGDVVPERELPTSDARALLAYLVTRRGRTGPASSVAAALWPEAPDARDRLAAAREELRALLPEPTGGASAVPDGPILDLASVTSDFEVFTVEAEQGLAAHRDGLAVPAERHLQLAEASYGGVLLEDAEPRPWLTVARDDASEAYLQVVTALVDLAERRADNHAAVRLLLRVLERDPYDEGAHLRLIACLEGAGRRGEARRRYRGYTARMQQIGVEPAPFPDVSPATPSGRSRRDR